jgi:hypothetical protein
MGTIASEGEEDSYTFAATAGEAVVFAAVGTSESFCARAQLLGPLGSTLGFTITCNDTSPSVSLPDTGTYTIAVSADDSQDTGDYSLGLQFTTGRCATSAIACGQTPPGVLGKAAQVNAYTFTATAGDIVSLAAVTPVGSSACTKLRLFDDVGAPRGESTCNASVDTAPLQTGTYTVLVSDDNLTHTGNYNLGLQLIMPARCATSIMCDQHDIPPGSITMPAQMNAYTFEGTMGHSLQLSAGQTSGSSCIGASLYDPAGHFLGNTLCITLHHFGLPASGTYTILVLGDTLQQTGSYNLSLMCSVPE